MFKINNLIKIYSLLIVFLFSSCEYVQVYNYEVENKTNFELLIELDVYQGDTTLVVGPNETMIIYENSHFPEGKNPRFHDVSEDLFQMEVTLTDSVPIVSSRDYIINSSWQYCDGKYTATVRNSEFN